MSRKIIILGTGAAMVTDHYQASFIVEYDELKMLVDTMGGYDIYRALIENKYSLYDINTLFISHRHLDHAMGFPWIVRLIRFGEKNNRIDANYRLKVLCSPHVKKNVIAAAEALCPDYWQIAEKYMEFIEIADRQEIDVREVKITPLDLKSQKEEQHGFVMKAGNYKLYFTGDEPLREEHKELAMDADLLIHECFCLDAEEEKYGAHEKAHSTAKEAALNATVVNAKRLLLIHIADEDSNRKQRYTDEAQAVFTGSVYVPDDGELISL
jgi:ribonuclease Z